MKKNLLSYLHVLTSFLYVGCNSTTPTYYQQKLPWTENYDEKAVPPYELPPLLNSQDGTKITTAKQWETLRRPELLKLFKSFMYGNIPPRPDNISAKTLSCKYDAVENTAIRQEVELTFSMNSGKKHSVIILVYLPKNISDPVPAFVGLTFHGNHVAEADPEIKITGLTLDPSQEFYKNTAEMRGTQNHRFPLKEIISRGYAIAFCSYHDIFPDRIDGWQQSIYQLFFSSEELAGRPSGYSAIGAWAWGISVIADYLAERKDIDPDKLAVFGHSRLGKTALWAGACDQRFQLVCVNDSGCGGAALSRRLFGETLFSMCFSSRNKVGMFWFTDSLASFAATPEKLPVDQHQLLALVAPRALCVHSATKDLWADPKGEYLSLYHAGKVFKLYGKNVLTSRELPPADTPVGSDMSYMLRTGKHEILLSDWQHYLDMADRVFGKK